MRSTFDRHLWILLFWYFILLKCTSLTNLEAVAAENRRENILELADNDDSINFYVNTQSNLYPDCANCRKTSNANLPRTLKELKSNGELKTPTTVSTPTEAPTLTTSSIVAPLTTDSFSETREIFSSSYGAHESSISENSAKLPQPTVPSQLPFPDTRASFKFSNDEEDDWMDEPSSSPSGSVSTTIEAITTSLENANISRVTDFSNESVNRPIKKNNNNTTVFKIDNNVKDKILKSDRKFHRKDAVHIGEKTISQSMASNLKGDYNKRSASMKHKHQKMKKRRKSEKNGNKEGLRREIKISNNFRKSQHRRGDTLESIEKNANELKTPKRDNNDIKDNIKDNAIDVSMMNDDHNSSNKNRRRIKRDIKEVTSKQNIKSSLEANVPSLSSPSSSFTSISSSLLSDSSLDSVAADDSFINKSEHKKEHKLNEQNYEFSSSSDIRKSDISYNKTPSKQPSPLASSLSSSSSISSSKSYETRSQSSPLISFKESKSSDSLKIGSKKPSGFSSLLSSSPLTSLPVTAQKISNVSNLTLSNNNNYNNDKRNRNKKFNNNTNNSLKTKNGSSNIKNHNNKNNENNLENQNISEQRELNTNFNIEPNRRVKSTRIHEPMVIIDDGEEFESGIVSSSPGGGGSGTGESPSQEEFAQHDEPRVLPLRPIIRGPYDDEHDEEMSVVYAEQHAEIKLICEVDLDVANSVWFKNGQIVHAIDRSSRVADYRFIREAMGALTITNVMLEDDGKWQCEAENSRGYVENARPVKLVVLDRPKPPYLLIDSRRLDAGNIFVPVKENSELSLACVSEGGNPRPTLTWEVLLSPGVDRHAQKVAAEVLELEEIKNDKEREPYKINSGAKSEARLPAVYRAHHNARILCVMEHPTLKMRQNASILLDVQYTPSFAISRTPGFGYPLREGIEVSLKCDVDSNPPSTPRWQKDDGDTPVPQTGDGYLNFTSIRREHSGWYKCTSRHLNFQYSSIGYYLSVRYDSVDVTSEPDDQEVSVAASHNPNKGQLEVQLGGAVTLQCPQGSLGCWSHLDPVTSRLRGLGVGLTTPTGQFSLKDVVYQDAGTYKCIGQSPTNKKKLEVLQTVGVLVKGPPTVTARNATPVAYPGSPLHLTVEFCANPPAYAARWLHGDRVYTPGNQYGNTVLAYGVTDLPTPFCKEALLTYVSMHERVPRTFYFIVSSPGGVAEAIFKVNFTLRYRTMSNAIDEEEEEISQPEEIHFPVFGSSASSLLFLKRNNNNNFNMNNNNNKLNLLSALYHYNYKFCYATLYYTLLSTILPLLMSYL